MHRNPGQRYPTVAQPRRAIKNENARAATEAGEGGVYEGAAPRSGVTLPSSLEVI